MKEVGISSFTYVVALYFPKDDIVCRRCNKGRNSLTVSGVLQERKQVGGGGGGVGICTF